MNTRKGSAGGQVMAVKQREMALKKYYDRPNICLYCNKIIEVKDGHRVGDARNKKFCNHKCASFYNHQRMGYNSLSKTKIGRCEICKCEIELKRNANGCFGKRKYCSKCFSEVRAKNNGSPTFVANFTKDQLMNRYAKYYIGRSMIRKHAQKVFDNSGKSKRCFICGYDKHIDVAHVKSVSDFEGNILISVINSIDNLVGLCPNHHWEYDKGLIRLE